MLLFRDELLSILTGILSSYAKIISKNVPKNIPMLSKSEFNFVIEREKLACIECEKWVHVSLILFNSNISIYQSRSLLHAIEMNLFIEWSNLQYCNKRPQVVIRPLSECTINKYSHHVLYYTSGWVLCRLSHAKTEAKNVRKYFADFADCHSLTLSEAKLVGLPTRLTE